MYDDVVLQNEYVSAVIDRHSGRVKSLIDLGTGRDYIACGQTAGLEFLQTEKRSSNAWNIGRTIRDIPVEKCVELRAPRRQGDLLKTAEAVFSVEGGCRVPTQITVTYALKAGSRALEVKIKADWQEQGEDTIPVLTYKVPVCGATGKFNYIIPQGTIQRGALNNDVPGIGSGAACVEDGSALVLVSDSKYGYRGEADSLSVTLINSATSPDPYPERGIHNITLWLGLTDGEAGSQTAVTDDVNHALFYVPGNVHEGALPTTDGLVELVAGNAAVTSVSACEGVITVRGFETAGLDGTAVLRFAAPVKGACLTDLSESGYQKPLDVSGCEVTVPMGHNAIWMVKVAL